MTWNIYDIYVLCFNLFIWDGEVVESILHIRYSSILMFCQKCWSVVSDFVQWLSVPSIHSNFALFCYFSCFLRPWSFIMRALALPALPCKWFQLVHFQNKSPVCLNRRYIFSAQCLLHLVKIVQKADVVTRLQVLHTCEKCSSECTRAGLHLYSAYATGWIASDQAPVAL